MLRIRLRSIMLPVVFAAIALRTGGGCAETLVEAWQQALAHDYRIRASEANRAAAGEELAAARAGRYPVLTAGGSYTVRDNEPAFRFPSTGGLPAGGTFPYSQDEQFAFQTVARVPIYTGGAAGRDIDAARAAEDAAGLQTAARSLAVKLEVAGRYVDVLRSGRLLSVAESNVKSLAEHERVAHERFRNRVASRNDLLSTQVARSDAERRANSSKNVLFKSYAQYNRLLGRPLDAPVRLVSLRIPPTQPNLESLTDQAVRNRPELARLSAQAERLEQQAASVRAAAMPRVDAQGGYEFTENRFQRPEGIASAALTVKWSAFRGERPHKVRALLLQAERRRHEGAELESRIALDVRQAWLDMQEAESRLKITHDALARADENLRVARRRYAIGAGTNTEVLDAEALRIGSYSNHDVAYYDAVLAALRLRYLTGNL